MANNKLHVEVELHGVDTIAELARYKCALDMACELLNGYMPRNSFTRDWVVADWREHFLAEE